jgi:hypothetical protein
MNQLNNTSKSKLPQNFNQLLMEIGERAVLYRLLIYTINTEWQVYHNLSDPGCDLVIINQKDGQKIKIEVKTRQRLYTTGEKDQFMFCLSQNEYQNCNFLIGYWFEKNFYFIVPKEQLKSGTNKGKIFWKLQLRPRKDGSPDNYSNQFLERWDLLNLK